MVSVFNDLFKQPDCELFEKSKLITPVSSVLLLY